MADRKREPPRWRAGEPDHVPTNLARLMAGQGLSIEEVVQRTGLDRRTVQGILRGTIRPHFRTVHRLAEGLGVAADEFFVEPSRLLYRRFDGHTNPLVQEIMDQRRELFVDWTAADFEELHSHVGTGGALTREGAVAAAQWINRKRDAHHMLSVLLESTHREVVCDFLQVVYGRVRVDGS